MVTRKVEERRTGASRRRLETKGELPFVDSSGQPVLWNRRIKIFGRRKSDEKRRWTRKDIPGFTLMGILFLMLASAVLYLWMKDS